MKRKIVAILMALILIGLSACSSSASAVGATQATTTGSLSVPLELAIGTLKLEGTANALDAASAAKLLPLWKAVNSLSGSDTIAQVELDGLYQQIKATMTPAQVAAITAMGLTSSDMTQLAQAEGISTTQTGAAAGTTSQHQQDQPGSEAASAAVDINAGMTPPSGGTVVTDGGGPTGGALPASSSKTTASTTATTQPVSGSEFYAAVIKLLESKVS